MGIAYRTFNKYECNLCMMDLSKNNRARRDDLCDEPQDDCLLSKLRRLNKELTVPVCTLALALGTVLFYIFTNSYYSKRNSLLQIYFEDFSLISQIQAANIIIDRVEKVAFTTLIIISYYEFRKMYLKKKIIWSLPIYEIGSFLYLVGLVFYIKYFFVSWKLSEGNFLLTLIAFAAILSMWVTSHSGYCGTILYEVYKFIKLQRFLFYILLVLSIYFALNYLPGLYATHSATDSLKNSNNLKITLKGDKPLFDNNTAYGRLHSNGKYFVTRCNTLESPVYIISDDEVKMIEIIPKQEQTPENMTYFRKWFDSNCGDWFYSNCGKIKNATAKWIGT